jgi:small basic protein (TIGR04137 family)
MSVHSSLKIQGKLARSRNVLTRAERIDLMEQRRTWEEGDAVYGLPKTKVVKPKKGGKKKKKVDAPAALEEEKKESEG